MWWHGGLMELGFVVVKVIDRCAWGTLYDNGVIGSTPNLHCNKFLDVVSPFAPITKISLSHF